MLRPSTLPSVPDIQHAREGIHDDADDEAEARGDAGRLGGRELAGIDAPDHKTDGEEAEPGAQTGAQDAVDLQGLKLAPAVLLGEVPADQLHGHHHQDTRDHAADEKVADGEVHHEAVDDEDDARRNDDADGAARGGGGRGEGLVIAGLGHLRVHDRADGRGGGGVGAGDGGEEAAGAQGRHAHAAAHPAQNRVGEVHQPLGDAGLVDEVAGQDEERQRQQAEEVEALVKCHADVGEGEVDHQADAHHPEPDDEEDRHPDNEQQGDADGDESDQ